MGTNGRYTAGTDCGRPHSWHVVRCFFGFAFLSRKLEAGALGSPGLDLFAC